MNPDFLGKGMAMPIKTNARGGIEAASRQEKVRQSILMILQTQHGERVMRPNFGANLQRLVFAPNNAATASLARFYVEEALQIIQFGKIPPEGSQITARRYRYVANESAGNVATGTITVLRLPPQGVAAVINEKPAYGGTAWEKAEETLMRGPEALKNQNRAITVADYERLTELASTDIAGVRCLDPKKISESEYLREPIDRSPGKVNVIVVPNARFTNRQPHSSDSLKSEIFDFLNFRKVITSEVTIHDPRHTTPVMK